VTLSRPLAAALAVATLLACGSAARKLEEANALRYRGDPRGALAAYKAILAELGEGPLAGGEAAVRWKALRYAGDVSYLELGDFDGAIAYYRRIISLHPGEPQAYEARGAIGDIVRDRFADPMAAIAQYATIAASDAPQAAEYQLEVARQYLELENFAQARTEARILRERWPEGRLADEAQLLTAQAWSLEHRDEEALGAFQALLDRKPAPDVAARALAGLAHIHAQGARFDRALELYAEALPNHPNPESIHTAIEAVRDRRERARTATPGDRAAAFDHAKVRPNPRGEP
jgi:tetratricopeptide (TPR) repeat protein